MSLGQYMPLHWGEVALTINITGGGKPASGVIRARARSGVIGPVKGSGGLKRVKGRSRTGTSKGSGGTG